MVMVVFFMTTLSTITTPDFPWFNGSLPSAKRIDLLMTAMSTTEKISQLVTVSPAIPRLGLRAYDWWSEGSHGVAWAGRATVFPAPIAMGASFDVPGIEAAGAAVGREARAKHYSWMLTHNDSATFFGLDLFAPNLNLFIHPRWGRGQETFGEDPHVISRAGAAYIRGLQNVSSAGGTDRVVDENDESRVAAVATPKHAFAYNLESDYAVGGDNGQYRLQFDANVSRADLLNTYSVPFRAAVSPAASGGGGGRSVMCSYNGVCLDSDPEACAPMCANAKLLHGTLRGEPGYDGGIVASLSTTASFMLRELC